MERTLKVFLACCLGAGIGALVALEMGLWWLGAGIGFLTGYLSYEWGTVREVFAHTWRAATTKREADLSLVILAIKLFCWNLNPAVTVGIATSLLLLVSYLLEPHNGATPLIALLVCAMITLILDSVLCYAMLKDIVAAEYDEEVLEHAREVAILINPWRVYFVYLPLGLLKGTAWLAKMLWKVTCVVFVTIHSEVRLLCGVDAAIGATVGYFLGNALLGAAIGGILGVLNYKLISRQLLRLAS